MKMLFITGSRGEWGYIRPVLEICKRKKINYKLCVTNMHLLDSFGSSINEIKNDGFKIHETIYMALDGYNNITMAKSLGVLMVSLADVVNRVKPDWIILAGDRGETLISSIVSAYTNIPVAHIQAGELSGIVDGQARHAIGKFSNLHFASNIDAAKRLAKLGEQKFRIKLVGAPQLDDLYKKDIFKGNLKKIEKKYNLNLKKGYLLCLYHPAKQKIENLKLEFKTIFNFLSKIDANKIWISPNNDAGSSVIKNEFLENRKTTDFLFDNLPRKDYLILLRNAKCIVGNSSSGIIESSSFKIPCINIGDRQKGRYRAKNVIDVQKVNLKNLLKAYKKINTKKFKSKIKKIINPYGDGKSSERIINELLKTKIDDKLLQKEMTY